MEQDIVLFLIMLALITVFLYQIAANAKRREQSLKKTWKKAWGTASEKEYDHTKYESISHYFQQQLRKGKITEPYVDDITGMIWIWMRSIRQWITRLPRWSRVSVYLLRTPAFSEEKLRERDRLMEFFETRETERLRLQYLFYEIGGMPKYSVSDYIEPAGGYQA